MSQRRSRAEAARGGQGEEAGSPPPAKGDGAKTPGVPLPATTSATTAEKKRKKADEIDALFENLKESKKAKAAEELKAKKQLKKEQRGEDGGSGKKRIKLRKGKGRGLEEEDGEAPLGKGVRYDASKHDFAIKPWKFDSSGMPIYDPDTMKVDRGGGTALCPFDCNCCF